MALIYILYKLLLPGVVYYISYSWYKTYRQRDQLNKLFGCLPPTNYVTGGDPLLGLSFVLETIRRAKNSEYMQVTLERFRRFGTTYVNKRLLYETISTIDGENVKAIMTTNFEDFEMPAIRVKALRPLFGDGIFVSDGTQWSHARSLLRPIFTRQNMSPLLGRLETHFQLLLRNIPSGGQTVDLGQLFFYLTLDVATEFLVGQSTNILDPSNTSKEERQFAHDYLFCCTEAVSIIRLGPLHRLARSSKKALDARNRAWQYVDRYVDEAFRLREATEQESKDSWEYHLLPELAKQTDDRQAIREQILNILLASRDTTAALLGNLFFMLARHPIVYAKLRDEVNGVVGDAIPTEEQLKSMQWLRWCINESLRLHPVIPQNTRQASRDLVLPVGGGADGRSPILVKKGTNILMNVYSMHRREDVFGPDVETFKPERWDGLRPGWSYLPFSGGPRTCLGQQFALIEASYIVTRMAQTFKRLEARDDRPYTEYYTIALFSKHGTQVSLEYT